MESVSIIGTPCQPWTMADLLQCRRWALAAALALLTRFRLSVLAESDHRCSSRCSRKRSTLQAQTRLLQ